MFMATNYIYFENTPYKPFHFFVGYGCAVVVYLFSAKITVPVQLVDEFLIFAYHMQ